MTRNYHIGDTVKAISNDNDSGDHVGECGVVVSLDIRPEYAEDPHYLLIDFPTEKGSGWWGEAELTRISCCHETKTMNITNLARGILDKDYKNMIKAGWLQNDLTLTPVGQEAILADYLQ